MLFVGILSVISNADRKDSAGTFGLLTELAIEIECVVSFLDLTDRGISGTVYLQFDNNSVVLLPERIENIIHTARTGVFFQLDVIEFSCLQVNKCNQLGKLGLVASSIFPDSTASRYIYPKSGFCLTILAN